MKKCADFITVKGKHFRICYPLGLMGVKGNEIYELEKYCQCRYCKTRRSYNREPANTLIASTTDILKLNDIADFVNDWTCGNERQLERLYVKF